MIFTLLSQFIIEIIGEFHYSESNGLKKINLLPSNVSHPAIVARWLFLFFSTIRMQKRRKAFMVYTVKEIQQILRISKTTAYALIDEHLFPVKYIGRSIRIPKEPFDKWLNDFINGKAV